MYLYAIEKFDVERITHKYLIVGHTENEGDSMHSCIEKERNRIVYICTKRTRNYCKIGKEKRKSLFSN
jgi:hypothetical protein